jgi:hypothetical protein
MLTHPYHNHTFQFRNIQLFKLTLMKATERSAGRQTRHFRMGTYMYPMILISILWCLGLKMLVRFLEQGLPIRSKIFRTNQNLFIILPATAQ